MAKSGCVRLTSLKAQRELAGLTQDALARAANVGFRTIVGLEAPHPTSEALLTSGACEPWEAQRISDALGVSLATLGRVVLMLLLLVWPMAASAQSVYADRLVLNTGCTVSSGSGAPSGGGTCDTYLDTSSGDVYTKLSGVWEKLPRLSAANTWSAAQTMTSTLTVTGRIQSGTRVESFDGTKGFARIDTTNYSYPAVYSLTPVGAINTLLVNPEGGNVGVGLGLSGVPSSTLDIGGQATFRTDAMPYTGYTSNLGSLSDKYLTLHAAELWVETLVAQSTMATIGGRILVAPTTQLCADLASGATTMDVKHNQMSSGDIVYLEANGKVEFVKMGTQFTTVACGAGTGYRYNITTRNLDGSGANDWNAGDAVLNTGQTGNGFIDLYSTAGVLSGSGPTIVGNVRTGNTYNNLAARWAIGNLRNLYGYGASDVYGVAMGDPSATNVTIDATNGLRIRNGTTNKLTADTSGNLSLVGDLSVGTSGSFRSNATAFGTGTGWWMDYNSGSPRWRVGNPSGNFAQFDGTDYKLVAANLTIDSSASAIAITPGTTTDPAHAYTFGFSGGGQYGLYGFTSGGVRNVDVLALTPNGAPVATAMSFSATSGFESTGLAAGMTIDAPASGNNIVSINSNYEVILNASGKQAIYNTAGLGIGMTPSNPFAITSTTDGTVFLNNTSGVTNSTMVQFDYGSSPIASITCTSSSCTYNTTSDRRMKTDLAATHLSIADVMRVPVYDGRYIRDDHRSTFVIAQDVARVLPDAVMQRPGPCDPHGDMSGCWQVDYGRLTPLLLAGEQDLQRQIDALRAELATVKSKAGDQR